MPRKPSKNSDDKTYFGNAEELAVLDYLNEKDSAVKNTIFETRLRKPIEKLVKSIIGTYRLQIPDESYQETYSEVYSFLITKMDKFNPEKNAKAFSYYGTTCKNHLLSKIKKYNKDLPKKVKVDFSDDEYSNNICYSTIKDSNAQFYKEVYNKLFDTIVKMIKTPEKYSLTEEEYKVGKALVNALENWDYIMTTNGSYKLNKSTIMLFLREQTGMEQRILHKNLKRFKKELLIIKDKVINE